MKLTIINIANKMPDWVDVACKEYAKRINHGKYSCKIIEIKSDKNPNVCKTDTMNLEAKKIKSQIPNNSFVIALDEKGVALTSVAFAKKLDQISIQNSNITFLIGGADGLDQNLKNEANLLLQLSCFTYPHALVRVIILEQLYRAISILENHPYHRE